MPALHKLIYPSRCKILARVLWQSRFRPQKIWRICPRNAANCHRSKRACYEPQVSGPWTGKKRMEAGPVVSRKVKVWPCLHSVPNYPAGAVVPSFLLLVLLWMCCLPFVSQRPAWTATRYAFLLSLLMPLCNRFNSIFTLSSWSAYLMASLRRISYWEQNRRTGHLA